MCCGDKKAGTLHRRTHFGDPGSHGSRGWNAPSDLGFRVLSVK